LYINALKQKSIFSEKSIAKFSKGNQKIRKRRSPVEKIECGCARIFSKIFLISEIQTKAEWLLASKAMKKVKNNFKQNYCFIK